MKSIMHEPVVLQARKLAGHWHSGQLRKYSGYPYIEHCEAAACLLALATGDPEVVAAGWLHDVLEDTDCTAMKVENDCGVRVYTLVEEVTDISRPEDGNRAARKAVDRAHLSQASHDGKSIKLADMIDNTQSIVSWDPDFARVYLVEMGSLLPDLWEGNSRLYSLAEMVLRLAGGSLVRAELKRRSGR